MALETRQKRAAVIGAARLWYRNPHPSSMDEAQRPAVGQTFPVGNFQDTPGAPDDTNVEYYVRTKRRRP